MADDQRNFRSYYYAKVGFPGVEEKKSLEILLKDNELDDVKLAHFCVRFPMPAAYRLVVWKVLLKVLPKFRSNYNFVWESKCETFADYHLGIMVTQLARLSTPKPLQYLKMYLISEFSLLFDHKSQETEPSSIHFMAIAAVFVELCPTDEEAYFLTTNFFELIRKYWDSVPVLVDSVEATLLKEDPALHAHLMSTGALRGLPISTWFHQAFAGLLPVTPLARVWDRIIGGSIRILPYVVVALLMGLRRPLHAANSPEEALSAIKNMTEETADVITNKAIDVWQKYGSPLGIGTAPAAAAAHSSSSMLQALDKSTNLNRLLT